MATDICPGCNNPRSPMEILLGYCAKTTNRSNGEAP